MVDYEQFRAFVRDLAQRDDLSTHGLLPIPALRREVGARLSRAEVDGFLVRLHGEGGIHLLSHVEFDLLPEVVRRDALRLPSGPPPLYWIRWL